MQEGRGGGATVIIRGGRGRYEKLIYNLRMGKAFVNNTPQNPKYINGKKK